MQITNERDNAHNGWSVTSGNNVKYFLHDGVIVGAPDDTSGGASPVGSAVAFAE
jgi:hypothetical protein